MLKLLGLASPAGSAVLPGDSVGSENKGMRKRLISSAPSGNAPLQSEAWLDLERIAQVEVTSEDHDYPIESVFNFGKGPGWRAAGRGEQTIRLVFDRPQRLKCIWLRFLETEAERLQQFTIRCWPAGEHSAHEVVRQQWNFSPHGSTTEIEDYKLNLDNVSVLELTINPDLSRGEAVATLAECRLA